MHLVLVLEITPKLCLLLLLLVRELKQIAVVLTFVQQ